MTRKAAGRATLAVLLAIVLGIAAVACGGQAATTTSAGGATTTAGAPTTAGAATTSSVAATTTSVAQPPTGSDALTVGATEGPYYISGTRELADGNLNYTGLPGDPIKVSGYVYGGTGTSTPLPGAIIEIWQADADGTYHPASNGDAAGYSSDQLALRGYVVADSSGHYEFTSIYPGIYPGRCRHIHVRASAPGYGPIVSQLIAPAKPGDSDTPQTDQIAQALPAVNDLTFTDVGGVQQATFDFHLGAD